MRLFSDPLSLSPLSLTLPLTLSHPFFSSPVHNSPTRFQIEKHKNESAGVGNTSGADAKFDCTCGRAFYKQRGLLMHLHKCKGTPVAADKVLVAGHDAVATTTQPPYNHHTTTIRSTKEGPPFNHRAANSRGPGGPTGPLGTPSRTPWILSR